MFTTRTDGKFDYGCLERTAHRPWPMPSRPWVMTQTWSDLLFAHWPVPPEQLAPHLPDGLELDLFAGTAWLGVVPFRMSNVSARGVPNIPGLSAFPELNVRTYVTRGGRYPGVFFFSLDAASRAAVNAARLLFNLPYYFARMEVRRQKRSLIYISARQQGVARFEASYRPIGDMFTARPGTLEAFLTERYCLYVANRRGQLRRLEIHHPPWVLRNAAADIVANTMSEHLPRDSPLLLHFADRQDVVTWLPVPA